jgi:hypothetical protein
LCHPKQNDYYKVATGKKISKYLVWYSDSNTVIREYQDYGNDQTQSIDIKTS